VDEQRVLRHRDVPPHEEQVSIHLALVLGCGQRSRLPELGAGARRSLWQAVSSW
jgi:hypothetical protein